MMRALLVLLFAFLTPGLVAVLYRACVALASEHDEIGLRLAAGAGIGALAHWAILGRLSGYATALHETKHALVALLFLRRLRRFVVTWRRGGYVQHSRGFGGSFGDHTIGLAPYFLPLFSLALAAAVPFLSGQALMIGHVCFGAALVLDALSIRREIKKNFHKRPIVLADGSEAKTDVGRRGYLFSAACVVFFGAWCLLCALTILLWGYGGLWDVARSLALVWYDTALWVGAQAMGLSRTLGDYSLS